MSLAEAGAAAGAMVLLTGRLRGLAGSAGGLYESSLYLEDYTTFVEAAPRIEAARPTRRRPPTRRRSRRADRAASPTRAAPSRACRRDARAAARRGRRAGRARTARARRRSPSCWPGSTRRRPGRSPGTASTSATLDPDERPRRGRRDLPGLRPLPADRRTTTSRSATAAAFEDVARGRARRARRRHARAARRRCRTATRRCSAPSTSAAATCRAASGSASRWRARSSATRPFVILDEPTASLDPRAEADLYASMRATCSPTAACC